MNYNIASYSTILNDLKCKEKIDRHLLEDLIISDYVSNKKIHYTSEQAYKSLRTQLINVKKNIEGEYNNVVYRQSEYKYGRVYAENSLSLGNLERSIRHLLAEDNYVDIDVKNCHPVILLQICKSYKMSPIVHLENYVDNREKVLEEVRLEYGVSRDVAKNLFLVLMYGGGFETWANNNGVSKKESSSIKEFKAELSDIMETILTIKNRGWYEEQVRRINIDIDNDKTIKNKKDKKEKKESINYKSSLMSIYLQHWEMRCLEIMYKVMKDRIGCKYENVVLCYDGMMILKDDYKEDLLDIFSSKIKEELGLELILEEKGFNLAYEGKERLKKEREERGLEDIQMDIFDEEHFKKLKHYKLQKEYFEKFHCKIRYPVCIVLHNRLPDKENKRFLIDYSIKEFDDAYQNYNTLIDYNQSGKFVDTWLNDPDMLSFNTIDFLPMNQTENEVYESRFKEKNKYTFNQFMGYNDVVKNEIIKGCEDKKEIEAKVMRVIEYWKDIVLNLCENNQEYYEFYVNVLAFKLKFPTKRLNLSVIFKGKQGTGKNLHLKPIETIIGRQCYFETSKFEDIFGEHATGLRNKLLLVLNEVEGKDSLDFEGKLKDLITNENITINAKYKNIVDIINYILPIITTNKPNPLKIDIHSGNRRFIAYQNTDKYAFCNNYLSKQNWIDLQEYFQTPLFISSLYYYLINILKCEEFNFSNTPNNSKGMRDLLVNSQGHLIYWLQYWLTTDNRIVENVDMTVSELYKEYKYDCDVLGIRETYTCQKFQNVIVSYEIGIETHKDTVKNQNKFKFNIKNVVEKMIYRKLMLGETSKEEVVAGITLNLEI